MSVMTPEQIKKQKDKKMKQLKDLIDGNAVTVKDYSKEKWPPWLLKTEDCIDELLDELGADRQNKDIARARQIIADFASKKKGKLHGKPGLESVEFAGRDELKGDYYFANRAQRLHAEEPSNVTLARLDDECKFLQKKASMRRSRRKEKEREGAPEAVSKQATDFLVRFTSASTTLRWNRRARRQRRTTRVFCWHVKGARSRCRCWRPSSRRLVRASSALMLVDALDVAPKFDKFVGRQRLLAAASNASARAKGAEAHRRSARSDRSAG